MLFIHQRRRDIPAAQKMQFFPRWESPIPSQNKRPEHRSGRDTRLGSLIVGVWTSSRHRTIAAKLPLYFDIGLAPHKGALCIGHNQRSMLLTDGK